MPSKEIVQDNITADATGTLASAKASTAGANLRPGASLHIISSSVAPVIADNAWLFNSVCLPVDDRKYMPLTGSTHTIRNDSAYGVNVFPQSLGIISCSAGNLGADVAYRLEAYSSAKFYCKNGLDWIVVEEPAYKSESMTGLATARTLLASETGKTLFITKYAGETKVNLPAPAQGLKFKFVNVDTQAQDTTITATADIISGSLLEINNANDASSVHQADGATSVRFEDASVPGDTLIMESDGTNWFVTGWSSVADGFAFV